MGEEAWERRHSLRPLTSHAQNKVSHHQQLIACNIAVSVCSLKSSDIFHSVIRLFPQFSNPLVHLFWQLKISMPYLSLKS